MWCELHQCLLCSTAYQPRQVSRITFPTGDGTVINDKLLCSPLMKNENWSREELVLALNLYFKLPFGRLHTGTPEIQALAMTIDRTVNSVAMRLNNFASLDPYHINRGVGGLKNVSRGGVLVWDEFMANREDLVFEAEKILAEKQHTTIEARFRSVLNDLPAAIGEDRLRLVKTRVNQSIFRQTVMANYNSTCPISGLTAPDLLVGSHIIPWAVNSEERLNPENGLCLSAIHDRAFDSGLIAINTDYKILLSQELQRFAGAEFFMPYFGQFEGKTLLKPGKYLPREAFLEYHLEKVFKQDGPLF